MKLAATGRSRDEPVRKHVRKGTSREKATRALTPSLESHHSIRDDLLTAKLLTRHGDSRGLLSKRRAACAQGEAALPAVAAAARPHTDEPDSQAATRTSQTGGTSSSAQQFQLCDIRQDQVAQKHTLPSPSPCPEDSQPQGIISKSLRVSHEPQAICQDGKVAEHLDNEEGDYVSALKDLDMAVPRSTPGQLSGQP